MLKKIENLPPTVLGVCAEGKVTTADFETVLIPHFEEAQRLQQHVRFLFQCGPEFSEFTMGAAIVDFRVLVKYFWIFERCAIVTDSDRTRGISHFVSSLLPCPLEIFKNDQMEKAIEWLTSSEVESKLTFEMRDDGVLIAHPHGPLSKDDIAKLESIVDPWIEVHHELRGIVVCVRKFPGWKNIGSFIRHIEFINAHHKKVRRIAVAMNGTIPEIMSKVAPRFLKAEIKRFPFKQVDAAVKWANA